MKALIPEGRIYLGGKIGRMPKKFNWTYADLAGYLFQEGTYYYFKDIATRYLHNGPKEKEMPK